MKSARFVPFAFAVLLAACSEQGTAPEMPLSAPAERPLALVGPDEGMHMISFDTDAFGNTVMIAEYPAGVYQDNRIPGAVASVTIKTVIPRIVAGSSKTPCITSTVLSTDVMPGWVTSVKKPGGCDKEIQVQVSNASLRQSANFSFLYIFGKTKIDGGLIK